MTLFLWPSGGVGPNPGHPPSTSEKKDDIFFSLLSFSFIIRSFLHTAVHRLVISTLDGLALFSITRVRQREGLDYKKKEGQLTSVPELYKKPD